MSHLKNISADQTAFLRGIRLLAVFFKARLSFLVVFSSLMGALITGGFAMSGLHYLLLALGGFLVAGSANGANQWIEKEFDGMMVRTQNRPLVTKEMDAFAALLFVGISAVLGLIMLYAISSQVALISGLAWLLYVLVYTPMKRFSSFAVFIGAIPGALPILSGTVAAEGEITLFGFVLFAIQFIWQFPHFWAIAWVADEDYKKAGYLLLPSIDGEKDESTAWQAFSYACLLLPVTWVLLYNGYIEWGSFIVASVIHLIFIAKAWKLYVKISDGAARQLMFFSFIHLPLVLITIAVGVGLGL